MGHDLILLAVVYLTLLVGVLAGLYFLLWLGVYGTAKYQGIDTRKKNLLNLTFDLMNLHDEQEGKGSSRRD